MDAPHLLFSYGTFQHLGMQLDTFGRPVDAEDDVLPGFTVDYVETDAGRDSDLPGADVQPVLRRTGDARDKVTGVVLHVTDDELDAADEYEVAQHRRVATVLGSGRTAWVYVAA
ncbi:gamma-glutamylcyclotransferase family protein [Microbacterium xanthum]|uniref:gamma-glutamylcyclotransferase family protein n=1 Tax=Microbacterium xanthum TaxID=3079794 RepID=UPI002AD38FA2|nr:MULTISPECIES: gamma-glutamylcyclotransferase family protein [unclassified Microbacterium]MDZ8172002.1 gamma-glutamylcyclotransferase family protein [Microbacterium sp. KSW-48]MDZ8199907.1 gamma-glutamylcyclotransferase family protein [Microbacterium sp. SSW1-59]